MVTIIPQLNDPLVVVLLALSRSKMKRFASFFIYFALSNAVAFARPSGSVGLGDINLCSFISDVAINTTGAADVINTFSVSLDDV
jgi:hypothetical protein